MLVIVQDYKLVSALVGAKVNGLVRTTSQADAQYELQRPT